MRRPCGAAEILRGVNQKDVGKGLRKIAELASAMWVVFLGQQTDVIAQLHQPLKNFMRLLIPAHHNQVVG